MTMRRSLTLWFVFVLAAGIVLGLLFSAESARQHAAGAAPAGITISGPAADDQGKPGAWTCENRPWLVGDRFGDASADNFVLGQPLPGEYAIAIYSHTSARYYHAVFYSPAYGDLIIDYPFSSIAVEPGTTFPTGRYDPIGGPTLFYNGGMAKFGQALWGGGGGGDRGGRVYTWCKISP